MQEGALGAPPPPPEKKFHSAQKVQKRKETPAQISAKKNARSAQICKFRFFFSLILSENMQNVHFREAKFQKCLRTPLVGLALDPIFA